jgi:hypothetical protein
MLLNHGVCFLKIPHVLVVFIWRETTDVVAEGLRFVSVNSRALGCRGRHRIAAQRHTQEEAQERESLRSGLSEMRLRPEMAGRKPLFTGA